MLNEEQKETGLFKLYRVVDKHTGLAFQSYRRYEENATIYDEQGYPMPYFTELGCFYRTLKSAQRIITHCTHRCTVKDENGTWVTLRGKEEIDKRVNRYYVEIYQVLQLSKTRIEGKEFLKKNAIENIQAMIYEEECLAREKQKLDEKVKTVLL